MDADARRPAEIKRWMEKWQDHCDTLDPQEDPDWAVAEFVADAIAQAVKERNERIADLKRSADASHLAASNECARANNATEIARQQAEEIVRYKKGCWEWPGKKSAEGYGQGRGGYAHRLAWQALNGPIPEGLQIDHLCRNRACVRPDHMELVTRKENILRGVSPQAINGRKTQCTKGHPYDVTWKGKRYCRTCRLAATRTWKAKKRKALHPDGGAQ